MLSQCLINFLHIMVNKPTNPSVIRIWEDIGAPTQSEVEQANSTQIAPRVGIEPGI